MPVLKKWPSHGSVMIRTPPSESNVMFDWTSDITGTGYIGVYSRK